MAEEESKPYRLPEEMQNTPEEKEIIDKMMTFDLHHDSFLHRKAIASIKKQLKNYFLSQDPEKIQKMIAKLPQPKVEGLNVYVHTQKGLDGLQTPTQAFFDEVKDDFLNSLLLSADKDDTTIEAQLKNKKYSPLINNMLNERINEVTSSLSSSIEKQIAILNTRIAEYKESDTQIIEKHQVTLLSIKNELTESRSQNNEERLARIRELAKKIETANKALRIDGSTLKKLKACLKDIRGTLKNLGIHIQRMRDSKKEHGTFKFWSTSAVLEKHIKTVDKDLEKLTGSKPKKR